MSDTLTQSLEEKKAEAKALLAEVKEAAAKGGGDDGEDYAAHIEKMNEVRRLGAEIKAEKTEKERQELLSLLEAFEKQTAAPPAGMEDAGIVSGAKNRLAEIEETKARKSEEDDVEAQIHSMVKQRVAIANNFHGNNLMKAYKPDRFQKVAVEGTPSAGGYLTVPEYFQNLFAAVRGQGNAIRRYGWLNVHPTNARTLLIPTGGGSTTVGWTPENTTKPTSDLTFGQITVSIFTLAGLAYVSNQMLEDSDPAIAQLAAQDMALRLGNAEEAAIINGSGTNQPRGILNTTGINDRTTVVTASPTQQLVIDAMIDGVADIQTNYFGAPNGILMTPRRLSWLQKAKDTATNYLFNAVGTYRAPGSLGADSLGVTSSTQGTVAPMAEIFGLPIGVSQNIPRTLTYGSGTGEDAIIIGAWEEAHWFQRQDVTVDMTTEGAGAFEGNLTVYREEERAGFTAARFPQAFTVVSGPGLING